MEIAYINHRMRNLFKAISGPPSSDSTTRRVKWSGGRVLGLIYDSRVCRKIPFDDVVVVGRCEGDISGNFLAIYWIISLENCNYVVYARLEFHFKAEMGPLKALLHPSVLPARLPAVDY